MVLGRRRFRGTRLWNEVLFHSGHETNCPANSHHWQKRGEGEEEGRTRCSSIDCSKTKVRRIGSCPSLDCKRIARSRPETCGAVAHTFRHCSTCLPGLCNLVGCRSRH